MCRIVSLAVTTSVFTSPVRTNCRTLTHVTPPLLSIMRTQKTIVRRPLTLLGWRHSRWYVSAMLSKLGVRTILHNVAVCQVWIDVLVPHHHLLQGAPFNDAGNLDKLHQIIRRASTTSRFVFPPPLYFRDTGFQPYTGFDNFFHKRGIRDVCKQPARTWFWITQLYNMASL